MQGFCSNLNCKRLIYDVEDASRLTENAVIECQHCHTINENPRYAAELYVKEQIVGSLYLKRQKQGNFKRAK